MSDASKAAHLAVKVQADSYDQAQLTRVLRDYQISFTGKAHAITDPELFNFIFSSQIGPTDRHTAFCTERRQRAADRQLVGPPAECKATKCIIACVICITMVIRILAHAEWPGKMYI